MSSIFFTADTHFGSDPLIRYENPPFADPDEMDRELIARWNAIVSPDDTVWHLGDFGADGHESKILAQLNGTVRLVRGNHDVQNNDYYRSCGFAEVYDLPVILDGFWILSHELLYVSTNTPYANLFGHVHASPIYIDLSAHHFCVCVERTDYAPISFDEVKRRMTE